MQNLSSNSISKPVVALMGEFSAGKSTLANLLIDEGTSPVRVTATQVPPIWYTYGEGDILRVDMNGTPQALSADQLESVSVKDTAYILVKSSAEVLELMDVIDMPGISDPNLSSDAWLGPIQYADIVVWCSHATQAWRQSEAATWQCLPERQRQHGMLLLTRFDKLLTDKDRQRVLKRVESETAGLFHGIFPVSLLQAATAEGDREIWESSGAEPFMQALLEKVLTLSEDHQQQAEIAQQQAEAAEQDTVTELTQPERTVMPKRVRARPAEATSKRPPKSAMQDVFPQPSPDDPLFDSAQ